MTKERIKSAKRRLPDSKRIMVMCVDLKNGERKGKKMKMSFGLGVILMAWKCLLGLVGASD